MIAGLNTWTPPRGAVAGPLASLIPVFVDVETYMDKGISLSQTTLRQYLAKTHMTAMAIAIGEEPPEIYGFQNGEASEQAELTLQVLRTLAADPKYVFVAHNAAFDIRVLRFLCGVPHPRNVWCSMEGAMAAWPDLKGGYGLANCAEKLNLGVSKLELDLALLGQFRHKIERAKKAVVIGQAPEALRRQIITILAADNKEPPRIVTDDVLDDVLLIYNRRDVQVMQELYFRQLPFIGESEQKIALMTHRVRRNVFKITSSRLDGLVDMLNTAAEAAEKSAEDYVADNNDIRQIFNREKDGTLQSIRYQRLKKIINTKMGAEDFTSTSLKKISPVALARRPKVAALLEQTTRAAKMIFHKRRSEVFRDVDEVDAELGYARACTFRFSSPAVGRGLNLHNCVSSRTQVLTERGFVPILHLNRTDKVWDGEEFVSFDHVKYEGERFTTKIGLLELTKEQPVLVGGERKEAAELTPEEKKQCEMEGAEATLKGALQLKEEVLLGASGASLQALIDHVSEETIGDRGLGLRVLLGFLLPPLPVNYRTVVGDAVDLPMGTLVEKDAVFDLIESGPRHRFSANGIITFNCPKHDKAVARPIRQLYRVPDHLCLVRGDLANIEYRIEGALTGCKTVLNMFESNVFADPYCESWRIMTGQKITKAMPIRQVSKCLAEGTPVLTPRGYAPIERVSPTDMVWDGSDWVCHGGVVCSGLKDVIEVNGVWMTLDHLILTEQGWAEAWQVVERKLSPNASSTMDARIVLRSSERALRRDTPTSVSFAGRSEEECRGIKSSLIRQNIEVRTALVYDVTNAGPEQCYQVKRSIVHNSAVLGLGFRMSAAGYAKVLLKAISTGDVSLEMLETVRVQLLWLDPGTDVTDIVEKLGCPRLVALAAYHIHRAFNAAHPEFGITANWLVRAVQSVIDCRVAADPWESAERRLRALQSSTAAPDPDMLSLHIDMDRSFAFPSVRVKCGPWEKTLCWREPAMRVTVFDGKPQSARATICKATGVHKAFTPQLAIENVTQAAARNMLCHGLLQLEKLGYEDILHVHDEVMLLVPRQREAVLRAKDDILKVFGPEAKDKPLKWAVLIKPDEVTVTQSLYEDESDIAVTLKDKVTGDVRPGPDRWGKILAGAPGCLDNLP